jgi:hypothetical protein
MGIQRLLVFSCLCFFSLLACAQPKPAAYDARWKTIDSLIARKGLWQTALTEVNAIAEIAKQEKNEPQLIKALVYRLSIEQSRSDSGALLSIRLLEKELAMTGIRPASRAILQCILAGVYSDYLQQNQYTIAGRTNTTGFVKTDVATWTVEELSKKIVDLYLSALKDEELLWQTPVANYSPIVIRGDVPGLRPTLFDLLAHSALDRFAVRNYDPQIITSEKGMDDPALFLDAAEFARHSFANPDSFATHFQAVLLYQRLIRRHLADARPDALIDADLGRIVFANQYSTAGNKAESYRQSLVHLADRYGNLPAATQVWYMLAQDYANGAGKAVNGGDTLGNVKAVAICEKVMGQKDTSFGWLNCRTLLEIIRSRSLLVTTEKANIPGRPFRALVAYRNFSRLFLRLIPVDAGDDAQMNIYDSSFWRKLLTRPVLRSWWQELPDSKDYLEHETEIAVGSLPPGKYALVAATSTDWRLKESVLSVQRFLVTRISFINKGTHYHILDRETGQPLAGAQVQVWYRASGATGRPFIKGAAHTADANGYVHLERLKDQPYNPPLLEVSIPGDHYAPTYEYVSDSYGFDPESVKTDTNNYEARNRHGYLFTDRSIYRPGQLVFFKGIEVTEDAAAHTNKPVTGYVVKLLLLDANQQRVDSISLTTNAFGSYNGSFHLPEHRLNGSFTIKQVDDRGLVNFSVEEYKRPKFYVNYEKQKSVYRIGDSIRVTGLVNAYSGNAIGGAKVVYRVIRKASSWYSFQFRRRQTPSSQEELTHGEMTTDGQGRFSISFLAAPDKTGSPATNPEYTYEVNADVTDINGETRSGQTDILAGYTTIRLGVVLAGGEHRPADSLCRVTISTMNLSGEPVSSPVHLALYPLQAPQRMIRERLWPAPDRYVLSEKEFLDSFPHDEYREESKPDSWERDRLRWEQSVSVGSTGKDIVDLTGGNLAAGWYLLEASAVDSFGKTAVQKLIFELYDGRTGKPGSPQYVWESSPDLTVQPGVTVATTVGTSASDVHVIRTVERPGKSAYQYLTLDKERKTTAWVITEKDRGGFGVQDVFVKDNRVYKHYEAVSVPWTNKELAIHYASYRDKTQPGSKEQWRLKITGARGEQVSAEVLMAMYDASLDAFAPQSWTVPHLYPVNTPGRDWSTGVMFGTVQSQTWQRMNLFLSHDEMRYDQLLRPLQPEYLRIRGIGGGGRFQHDMNPDIRYNASSLAVKGGIGAFTQSGDMYVHAERMKKADASGYFDFAALKEPAAVATSAPPPVARKDFRETAFFVPDVQTDSAGNVSFSFTMPEALTSWKWMTLAHTRDLSFGYDQKTIITQKELMVQPNAPRFLREGDRMELPVKITNLTDSELTGQVHLVLTDPTTGQTADGWFTNRQANQYFTVPAHGSVSVGFPLIIPYQYNRPLTYSVTAEARNYADGEEATLPVVSNRLLVTESLPLNMPGDGTKQFHFEKLLKSGGSETLNHHALTLEFTTNPTWYAVQALPYLMEYPYECAEQVFNRAYANALATSIVTHTPRLKAVFEKWRTMDTAALLSNLQKDAELKSILLEETPWVLQGKSEEQQKRNIALLFDLDRMSQELGSAIDKLSGMQAADGGFPWFKGGYDDRYMTQYIIAGIGRLQRLNAIPSSLNGKIKVIVTAALPWLDAQLKAEYDRVRVRAQPKKGVQPVADGWISEMAAHYLYMRSLFPNNGIPGDVLAAVSYFRKRAQRNWLRAGKYTQGMIALALFRTGDVQTAKDIIASLKQTAIHDEERGMYWKGMETGYYWYQAPVEIQSTLIEAFREVSGDAAADRELKTWLLGQKQTHHWPTTKATADACYALLLGGQEWLNAERNVTITLGDKTVDWPAGGGEAGTGYNKKVFDAPFVNPSMGNISVRMETKGNGSPAWGAVYWQYFDQLDRITPPGQGKVAMRIDKKLFVSHPSDRGPVLEPLADNGVLKPGDKVVVRIVITTDRELEYVHMKDMRGACFEPVNVISQYKWQDGLGYYESTKDVSTDFFFDRLPKGTHVFEYSLFTGQAGNFSNGVTTIECMYAPEFTFHSEGIRVNVEPSL